MIHSFDELKKLFIPAEETAAKVSFGNPPNIPLLKEADVVVYGVCFDGTATCGKGSVRGPEALRHVSARQIETLVLDEHVDVYGKVKIVDLGDFKFSETLTKEEQNILQSETASAEEKQAVFTKLKHVLRQFDVLTEVTQFLVAQGKTPLLIGGEHTLSYWPLLGVADKNPVVLHFDAHRDGKEMYMGMKLCHTTPFYHALKKIKSNDSISDSNNALNLVQIGIRQADQQEQDWASSEGVFTFYPRDVQHNFPSMQKKIKELTVGRNVYISFDIDALDICYTPCTGTPEPFGMTPEEVVAVFKAVDSSATLIGVDMVEVAVKNNDYREGVIAAQLLLRLFSRSYVK
jgi:agmatinase